MRQLADLAATLTTFPATDWCQAVQLFCSEALAISGASGLAFWDFRDDAMVLCGTAGSAASFGTTLLRPIPAWLKKGGTLVATSGKGATRYAELCRSGQPFGAVLDVPIAGDGSRSGALWFLSPSPLGDPMHPIALLLADQLRHLILRRTRSQAEATQDFTSSVIAPRDLRAVLASVADKAQTLLRSEAVLIALLAEHGNSVRTLCRGSLSHRLDGLELPISPRGSLRAARAVVTRRLREAGLATVRTHELQGEDRPLGLVAVARALGPALPGDGDVVFRAFVDHATIAVRITCLLKTLDEQQRELTRLTQHQFTVEEQERRRIALELHDEIGQSLTGILIGTQRMGTRSASPEIATACAELAGEVERVIGSVRTMAYSLRPPMLEALGLGPSLEWLAKSSMRHADATIDVDARLSTPSPRPFDACLYRITQEGLTNALRHSGAKHIGISVRDDADQISLVIADDGRGFDLHLVRPGESRGLGLLGMRERAVAMRGSLDIWSKRGSGTRLSVHLPLTRTHTDDNENLAS